MKNQFGIEEIKDMGRFLMIYLFQYPAALILAVINKLFGWPSSKTVNCGAMLWLNKLPYGAGKLLRLIFQPIIWLITFVGGIFLALFAIIILQIVGVWTLIKKYEKGKKARGSLLAKMWRLFCVLFDWRTSLRMLQNKPLLDAAFISNMRDTRDRITFLGGWHPPEGHFNGPRYWLNGCISGRTRALDVTAQELSTQSGRSMAKTQFINAAKWADNMGARVILFAAGTKRLFEGDYKVLFDHFPKMVFTIGDNGTFLLLKGETFRALENAGLKPGNSRIGILGPYGFLGELMTKALKNRGFDIIGAGPNREGLETVKQNYGINICETFSEMHKVDAVVCCTHSEKIRLTAESIDMIRRADRKLLVIDVSEPSNLTRNEYDKCRDRVIRQDAGNAYAKGLKYVLGAVSYKMFRLSRGVTFGCFAESLALAWALDNGLKDEVLRRNWLEVTDDNMQFVAMLFEKASFQIPSPRCFARPVKSFKLNLSQLTTRESEINKSHQQAAFVYVEHDEDKYK